jgi:two-component system, CitB family, sensor kinase
MSTEPLPALTAPSACLPAAGRVRRGLRRAGQGARSVAGQVMLVQTAMLLVLVTGVAVVCAVYSHRQIQSDYANKVLTIAETVASEPQVRGALGTEDDTRAARVIAPLALSIQQRTGVLFVVVADREGIRVAHPNPVLIGQPLSTAPGEALLGTAYVATQTGTLGTSLRAKAPVYSLTGHQVVGLVSVGVQLANLDDSENHALLAIALLGCLVLALSIGAVRWLSGHVRRQTHGLRSDEITRLLENREAVLHGLHEGMLAVDPDGRVHLVNDAARHLLDLPADVVGRPVEEVLPEGRLRWMMRGCHADDPDQANQLVVLNGRLLVASRSSPRIAGMRVGHTVTLRDQTELLRVTRKFDALTSTAKALRVQAHEFRNRLHVIAGLLELGQHAEAVTYITRIHQAQEREAGRLSTALGSGTLTALLLAKQSVAAERGCRLDVRVDGDEWRAALDRDTGPDFEEAVTTIVGNLVENALEELAGHTDGAVLVRLSGERDRLIVAVSDNGGGIPEHLRESVFLDGWSAREAETGPRGVGLALVRDTARHLHGDAVLAPSPAGLSGATIRVDLVPPAAHPAPSG